MNRFLSTLTVLAMALVAIAFCIRQTAAAYWIVLESTLALVILVIAASLIRKEYTLRQVRFEVAQPLRRLLSTVWS